MSEKKIYELLNQYEIEEDLEVEALDKKEIEKIQENVKKRLGKGKPKKRTWPKVAVAAVLILGFFFTNPGQKLYAHVERIYYEMFSPLSDRANHPEEVENLVTKPGESVEDQGIRVSVDEVLSDDQTLYINLTADVVDPERFEEFDDEKSLEVFANIWDIKVNGQATSLVSSSVGKRLSRTANQMMLDVFLNEDNIEDGDIINLTIEDIEIHQVRADDKIIEEHVQGDWSMDIVAENMVEKLHTTILEPHVVIDELEGADIILETIRHNDMATQITLNIEGVPNEISPMYSIIAKDDEGNHYYFPFSHGDGQKNTLVYDARLSTDETPDIERLFAQDEMEIELDLKVWKSNGSSGQRMVLGEPREGVVTVPLR